MFCPNCHNALSINDICDECGWKKPSTYTSKKSSKKRKSRKSAYSARLRKERQEEEARLAKTAIEGEVVDVETWKEGEGWSAPRRVEVTMDDGRRYRLADRLSGISEHAISDFTDEMNTKQWELIEDPSEDEEVEEAEEAEKSSDEDTSDAPEEIGSSTQLVARFIHKGHGDRTAVPTTWSHPRSEKTFEGAQTLSVTTALDIAIEGEHRRDDWFNPENYSHLAIFKVSQKSGESGPLPYAAITTDDIEEMRVIGFTPEGLGWALTEIGIDMEAPTYDDGALKDEWIYEVGEDKVIDRLLEKMSSVEPTPVTYS